MKPVIALVGRPNVGKSTLFNALTRRRDALVAAEPGLTRDRQYGDGRVGDRPYLVVDTGGLDDTHDPLKTLMTAQTLQAIGEADAVILLVDGRAGANAMDRRIAEQLRRLGKPLRLAVNKTEGLDAALATAEFHELGLGAPWPIASAHGQGIEPLLIDLLAELPLAAESSMVSDCPRIAVAGRPNVGKSTLINALLGEERVVVFDQPGTTRDSIRIPFEHKDKRYILIDTAGVRRRGRIDEGLEQISVIKTLQAIEEANVVILVLDAHQEIGEQDVHLAAYIVEQGRALVLAVNKWDGMEEDKRNWIKRELERKLLFAQFAPPHYISARNGTGVDRLLSAVDRAYTSAYKTFSTSSLNRILEKALTATPPPLARGRRIKLKFAHQGGKNPPRIIIHGNQVAAIPVSYARYLSNAFHKALKLEGTPLRIDFEQGENPFEGRQRARQRR
jgi:GTP-binding protein